MNRFFRTAYAATLVYLCLAFSVALIVNSKIRDHAV